MIAVRGLTSLVGPFLCVLAVGAVAAAARGQSSAGQPTVLASSVPTRLPHLPAGSGPSCPLTLPQQVKALKAFAEMMPVFRHARCINCHGGVNPFTDGHGGGAMDPQHTNEQCQECHDQLKGWDVPGPPMFFVGKGNEEICLQVKEFSPGGATDFVQHIRHDHGLVQFIAASFKGDRALNAQSLADHNVVIEKPPGTQAQLTEKARKWVKAMGGKFVGSPECGCVKPIIDLKMTSEWTVTGKGVAVTGQVSATVPLKPDSSGGLVFTGTAPLQHGRYTFPVPTGCRADIRPSGGELVVTEARFDIGAHERMTISLAVAPTMGAGTMALICPKIPYVIYTTPLFPWVAIWQSLHEADLIGIEHHFDQFEAASGRSLAGKPKLVGRKEVTRSRPMEGVTATAKTIFEFWWVGLEPAK